MDKHLYLSLIEDALTYIKAFSPRSPFPPLSLPLKEPPVPLPSLSSKKEVVEAPQVISPKQVDPSHGADESFIQLERPSVAPHKFKGFLKKLLLKIDSTLHLHDKPPTDVRATQVREEWKREVPTIAILFQGDVFRPFLVNIAVAIENVFAKCRLIEIEEGKDWRLFLQSPNLKFIVAPGDLIFSTRELLPLYKEISRMRYLGKTPLLLLPDLSLYYEDPSLKRSLWNMITRDLQPLF